MGLFFFAVHGFLIVASPVAEHRLWGIWSSVDVVLELSSGGWHVLEHELSSCGTWA